MQTQIVQTKRMFTLCTMAISASAMTAAAGAPSALDHVPPATDVVIGISEMSDFLNDVDQINRVLGANSSPELVFVTAMARGMPGVNLAGSAAILVDFNDDPEAGEDPTAIALIPVSDFGAFSQQRKAQDGLVMMPFPDAEVYARDIGHGFALLGDNPDALRAFSMTEGNMKAHAERLGGAGNRLAGGAEVTIIMNADSMRPYLNAAKAGMDEQGQMIGMMGGEQAAQGFSAFSQLASGAMTDLQTGVLGLSITESGMSYDMAMQFKEGSDSASNFAKGGNTKGLTSHLPSGPYMFAASLDTSSPAIKKLANAFGQMTADLPDELKNQMGMGQLSLKDLTELTEGVAFVMGSTPGLMGGGLFANTTQYIKTDKPGAYRQAMVSMMEKIDGQTNEGMTIDTVVSPDAVTIDGTSLTSYGMSFKMDPDAMGGGMMPGMDPSMVMGMVFGPSGGPAGYIGEVKQGVVQTLTQGPELTKKALAAAASGEGLGTSERFARVANALHADRAAEIYIGVDEILNTVGPMLMMFGVVPEFEPIDALDPIALAMTFDNGGLVGRVHVPMSTFQTLIKLVPEEAMNGGNDNDDGFDF